MRNDLPYLASSLARVRQLSRGRVGTNEPENMEHRRGDCRLAVQGHGHSLCALRIRVPCE